MFVVGLAMSWAEPLQSPLVKTVGVAVPAGIEIEHRWVAVWSKTLRFLGDASEFVQVAATSTVTVPSYLPMTQPVCVRGKVVAAAFDDEMPASISSTGT